MSDFVPPMIAGVSPSTIYLEKLVGPPVDLFTFLCQKFPHVGILEWRRRFDDGLVFWENGETTTIDAPYVHGRSVYYYRFLEDEVVVPFVHEVLYENDRFMVVDKPHFLAVTPGGEYVRQTLLTRLKQQTNNPDLSPIHRLDRETAGLILISKDVKTRGIYQSLFSDNAIHKIYHAIAPCNADMTFPMDVHLHLTRGEPFYTMRVDVNTPPNSHTFVHQLETQGDWAKYELHPTTGKLHQLRVHLNHLGMPIKNDPYYPQVKHKARGEFDAPLQLLAKSLSFIDPVTGEQIDFHSRRKLDF